MQKQEITYTGLPQEEWAHSNYPKLTYNPKSPDLAKRSVKRQTYLILLSAFVIVATVLGVMLPISYRIETSTPKAFDSELAAPNNPSDGVTNDPNYPQNDENYLNPNIFEDDHDINKIHWDDADADDSESEISKQDGVESDSRESSIEDSDIFNGKNITENDVQAGVTTTENANDGTHYEVETINTSSAFAAEQIDQNEGNEFGDAAHSEDNAPPDQNGFAPVKNYTESNFENSQVQILTTSPTVERVSDSAWDNEEVSNDETTKVTEDITDFIKEIYNEKHEDEYRNNTEAVKEWLNKIGSSKFSDNLLLIGIIELALVLFAVMLSISITVLVMKRKGSKMRKASLKNVVTDLQSAEKVILLDSESEEE